MQLLHHCVCTSLNIGLYVCASESQVRCTEVVVVSEYIVDKEKDTSRDYGIDLIYSSHNRIGKRIGSQLA